VTKASTVSRRQRIIEHTREEILLTAARLLAHATGGRTVSLADIAHEIGLTAPALYAYFESKQAIFSALVALIDGEIDAAFAARGDRHTPFRERLATLSRRLLELWDRRRDVFVALFAMHMRGEEVDALANRPPPPVAHLIRLTAWFRREAGPADLARHSAEDLATVFFGLHHGFFMRWMLSGASRPLVDDAERLLDCFFHGVSEPAARPRATRRVRSGRRQPR
jgi:AcrR family transcriptional regulator